MSAVKSALDQGTDQTSIRFAEIHVDLPERLQCAFDKQMMLANEQIYFAPIRHHSPSCAMALKHYIEQLQPTHILIEAPHFFEPLIADLLSKDTVPPVAIFAQAKPLKLSTNQKDTIPQADTESDQSETAPQTPVPEIYSAYFPFCEYSPEWVAMQVGHAHGAQLHFIDLDWDKQCQFKANQPQSSATQTNLMAERYLAHSQFIAQLAQRLHCRNQDELWDHLFELKSTHQLANPTQYFQEVLTWCALARLDYENEVLYQECSLQREYCMLQHIEKLRKKHPDQAEHKLLVVTGGFHTLALIEQLSLDQTSSTDLQNHSIIPSLDKFDLALSALNNEPAWQQDAWLIRYSDDRLDALNGYASGMPSPAYYLYQWLHLWQNQSQQQIQQQLQHKNHTNDDLTQQHFYNLLSELCHQLQAGKALEITTFTAQKNTAEIAFGLASLRGHLYPSRYDLLDALQTALIKGEMDGGQQYFWQVVHAFLSGQKLGKVAKNQRSPALLQQTYATAQNFRFKLDDTLNKTRQLDIYRKPIQQKISQFLHMLSFLHVGFATQLSGPDFIHGTHMDLLFEQWQYAWTPSVESRLIELAEQGEDIAQIALLKLQHAQAELQQQGFAQSAQHCAKLFAQACKFGLKQQLHQLQQHLDALLTQDVDLGSLIRSAQQLFYLWHGRVLLQLPSDALQHSLYLAIQQACYQLNQIYDTHAEKVDAHLILIRDLHRLIGQVQQLLPNIGVNNNVLNNIKVSDDTQNANHLKALFYQQIDLHQLNIPELSKLKGALHSIMYLDQRFDLAQLQHTIENEFAVGTDAEVAVSYLQGLMSIAPEVFIQSTLAIKSLQSLMGTWTEQTFLAILPDLRFIFSQLTPKQSHQLSQHVAQDLGLSNQADLLQVHHDISVEDVQHGSQLNHQLTQLLQGDGVLSWINDVEQSR